MDSDRIAFLFPKPINKCILKGKDVKTLNRTCVSQTKTSRTYTHKKKHYTKIAEARIFYCKISKIKFKKKKENINYNNTIKC